MRLNVSEIFGLVWILKGASCSLLSLRVAICSCEYEILQAVHLREREATRLLFSEGMQLGDV